MHTFEYYTRAPCCPPPVCAPQVNEAELPLIAILGPTGAKVFSFTGCMPAPDLATALAEFLDANDLESSDAVKPKVKSL